MRLRDDERRRVEAYFNGPIGDELFDTMFDLGTGGHPLAVPERLRAVMAELGWMTSAGGLTAVGYCVTASCREYRYWIERDRKLPFDTREHWLNDAHFADKEVLEVGAGTGTVLMSLPEARRAVGAEPFEIHIQVGDILRARDGIPDPEIVVSACEDLCFPDQSFDVVLCVTAHQYFDIYSGLQEISRVLQPGGELFIVGSTLREYLSNLELTEMRFAKAKKELISLLNTAAYSLQRKRLFAPRAGSNTSRPIYPSAPRLRKWMVDVGLSPDPQTVPVGPECFLRGVKQVA